jgi:hypothetical protein
MGTVWHEQLTISTSLLSLIRYSINPFFLIIFLTSSVIYVKTGMGMHGYDTLRVSDFLRQEFAGICHFGLGALGQLTSTSFVSSR